MLTETLLMTYFQRDFGVPDEGNPGQVGHQFDSNVHITREH